MLGHEVTEEEVDEDDIYRDQRFSAGLIQSDNVMENDGDTDEDDDLYGEQISPPNYLTQSQRDSTNHENYEDVDDDNPFEEVIWTSHVPKRPGRKRETCFLNPPRGELQHPCINWIIDKVTMDKYIPNYGKQEGFAFTKTQDGSHIRFRCVHAGKYCNRHNLPSEVTEKSKREELMTTGSIYLTFNVKY